MLDCYAVARTALDAAAGALSARPPRIFVSPNRPAAEFGCEQLAAWVEAIRPTHNFPDPARRPLRGSPQAQPMVTIALELTRCGPTGNKGEPPSSAALEDAASSIVSDAGAIYQALRESGDSGDLRDLCRDVTVFGAEFPTGTGGTYSALLRVAVAE